jgi:vacuolar-type H+-ATPase subunit H
MLFWQNFLLFFINTMILSSDKKALQAAEEAESGHDLNLVEMFDRLKENGGKMEADEDLAYFDEEVRQLLQKLVNSVKQASDQEREEIRDQAVRARLEIEAEAKVQFVYY